MKGFAKPVEALPAQYLSSNRGVAVAKGSELKVPIQKAMNAILADGTQTAMLKKLNRELAASKLQ